MTEMIPKALVHLYSGEWSRLDTIPELPVPGAGKHLNTFYTVSKKRH